MLNLLKKYELKTLIGRFGKIEVVDNVIIFHLNKTSLKIITENNISSYTLNFSNLINYLKAKFKDYEFEPKKSIYFSIENIEYNMPVNILGSSCNIMLRNCLFEKEIQVSNCGDLIFEKNKYLLNKENFKFYRNRKHFTLNVEDTKKIKFISDSIFSNAPFILLLNGEKVEIIDTRVWTNDIKINAENINIKSCEFCSECMETNSSNINIIHSNINLFCMGITAPNIVIDDSVIYSSEVLLENVCKLKNSNIFSDLMLVNGIKVSISNKEIQEDSFELQVERIKLILALKKMLFSYNIIINNNIKEKIRQINMHERNEPLKKILESSGKKK